MGQHSDDVDEAAEQKQGGSGGFLIGALLGGLIGLGAGLMLAPASGEDTRYRLRDRVNAVRDEAMQKADQARAKAKELETNSRDMIEAQKRRVARTAEAVKQSAQEAWSDDGSVGAPKPAEAGNGGMAKTTAGTYGGYTPGV